MSFRDSQNSCLNGCNCCFCLLALLFGILAAVYTHKSTLDIHHICELATYNTRLCQYSCGQYCVPTPCPTTTITIKTPPILVPHNINSNKQTDNTYIFTSNNNKQSPLTSTDCHKCYTKYCWGYQYVYLWRTMDYMYPPYKTIKISNNLFENKTEKLRPKINKKNAIKLLETLNEYLIENNTNITQIKKPNLFNKIMNINTDKYILNKYNSNSDIVSDINNDISTTFPPKPTDSRHYSGRYMCDAFFTSYGECAFIPWMNYYLHSEYNCWTNVGCSDYTWNSPTKNTRLAHGFSITAIVFSGILGVGVVIWGCMKCCDRY